MRIFTRHTFIIILSALSFLNFSCKTTRTISGEKIRPEKADFLISKVTENKNNFNTFSAKFNCKLEMKEKNLSVGGNIRIKKDSIIWAMVAPAGIEVARIAFTRDSIKILNRIENTFITADYNYLKKLLNLDVNYQMLEASVTGELFPYPAGSEISLFNTYEDDVDSGKYVISNLKHKEIKKGIRKGQNIYIHEIHIWPDIFKIAINTIEEPVNKRSLKISYYEYENIDGKNYPRKLNINAVNNDDVFNISLKYSKITADKDVNFPFKVPEKFEKIVY